MLISHAWGFLRAVWGEQNQQSVKGIAWCVILSQRSPQAGPGRLLAKSAAGSASRPCAFIIIGKQKNFDLHFLDSPRDNDTDFKYPLVPNLQSSFIHIHIYLLQCVLPANLSRPTAMPMAPTVPPMAMAATRVSLVLRHATTLVLITSVPTSL